MAHDDRSDRINHAGPKLIWQQVADDIEHDITSGRLSAGARLPAELDTAEQYGVSRISVRRAIKDLAARGLLTVVHGRGTFVSEQASDGEG